MSDFNFSWPAHTCHHGRPKPCDKVGAGKVAHLLALFAVIALSLAAGCGSSNMFCRESPCADPSAECSTYYSNGMPLGEFALPLGVVLEDGLSEDEAVATALSNNATYRATLAQLGMAEGDVVQAGLLTNPNLVTFLPASVKQWEWTLYLPLETFLLRPERLALAESDYERIAQQLVQNGLNLVRDVRVAYADFALAVEQQQLAEEGVQLRGAIADLTDKRLQRGDISELESLTARIDALNSQAAAGLQAQTVILAQNRLLQLMGLPMVAEPLRAQFDVPPATSPLDVDDLIGRSLATRPDLRAAEWAVEAAAHRARLAHWQFVRIDAAADANSDGLKGSEAGPGLRVDLPIFNRNQGGRLRAEAEVQQAAFNRDAVRDQIVQEVRTASALLAQSQDNLAILEGRVLPAAREAIAIAQRGYEDGGAAYFHVLQTTTQYLDARARRLDQVAALRRAHAELERCISGPLATPELIPLPNTPMGQ